MHYELQWTDACISFVPFMCNSNGILVYIHTTAFSFKNASTMFRKRLVSTLLTLHHACVDKDSFQPFGCSLSDLYFPKLRDHVCLFAFTSFTQPPASSVCPLTHSSVHWPVIQSRCLTAQPANHHSFAPSLCLPDPSSY